MIAPLLFGVALAWSPGVHREMAARAAALDATLPGAPAPEEAARFARAAAGEDLNLVRKWSSWHHYYVDDALGIRRPSVVRVTGLEGRIRAAVAEGDRAEAWRLAGLAVHHVQDMASPPHVVPVHHGLGDGFEHYDVTTFLTEASLVPSAPLAPTAAQATLADLTAAALDEPLVCAEATLDWGTFWVARPGRFGLLGDHRFGGVPGCDSGFETFARARVDAAVSFSRAVVRWVAALTEAATR